MHMPCGEHCVDGRSERPAARVAQQVRNIRYVNTHKVHTHEDDNARASQLLSGTLCSHTRRSLAFNKQIQL